MDTAATKEDIEELINRSDKQFAVLDKKIDKRFDDVMTVLQAFMQQVDNRFTKVENDFVDLKSSIDRLTYELISYLPSSFKISCRHVVPVSFVSVPNGTLPLENNHTVHSKKSFT